MVVNMRTLTCYVIPVGLWLIGFLFASNSFHVFQNFVGLSVSDGYVATGSETNEVSSIG